MDILAFGMKYWKKHLPRAVFCQIIGFVAIFVALLLPLLGQMIVDYVLNYQGQEPDTGGMFGWLLNGQFGAPATMELFLSIAAVYGSMVLLRSALLYLRNNLFIRNGINMESRLRRETYVKLVSQSSLILNKYNTGDLLTILNSDIVAFKELFAFTLLCIFDAVFQLVVAVVLLGQLSWYLVILPLCIAPFLIFTLRRFLRAARMISSQIRDCNADMNMVVSENINAVRLVRSFANEELEMKKFDQRNENTKNTYFRHADIISRYNVYFNTMRQVAYVGSVLIGTLLVLSGHMQVGILVACSSYVMTIMDNITQLNNQFFNFQQYLVSGGRIMVFLQTGNLIETPENPLPIEKAPHIRLNKVGLMMDDHQVLKDIDLDLPYGKKLGVMGGTGSGKTVLLKALTRLYDVTSGMITINGNDIRALDLEQVRRQFGFVFQDVFLFSNTIDANIAFADPDAPFEKVRKTAREAQAEEFIEKMPQGYDTIIGEKGLGLSGGQKQRISIARALLKDAPVLVLDDATSALDMTTERALLEAVKREYPDKTLIISAHRASSVKDCDEIIYLQDGEIVERGSFEEMMALNGRFARIYRKQSADMSPEPEPAAGGADAGLEEAEAHSVRPAAELLAEQTAAGRLPDEGAGPDAFKRETSEGVN